MHARHRRSARGAIALALATGLALAATGCGGDDYKNEPREPVPIVLTGSIAPERVSVSPSNFGAGPVTLVVTNQTDATQQVTLESAGGGSVSVQTGPINPRDTATLKAVVVEGDYEVRVDGDGVKPAKLTVGAERPSAQNDLLLP